MLKNGYLFDCKCNACENKIENYSNAFKCPICASGALVWNLDYTNKCSKCRAEDQDLNHLISKLNQTQDQFNYANELLSQCKWTECKQKLDDCKKALKTIFYSEKKMDNLYRIYMEYYTQREKYQKASKYASKLSRIQKEKDDKETLESVLYTLKSINLMVLHLKNSNSNSTFSSFSQQAPKKSIQKLRNSYVRVLKNFNEINSRQIKLLDNAFLPYLECFETIENYLESVDAKV